MESIVWTIAQLRTRVIHGTMGIRGRAPVPFEELLDWHPTFKAAIERQQLCRGLHWIQPFAAQVGNTVISIEVLRNKVDGPEIREVLTEYPWTLRQGFYSVRLFFVAKVGHGGTVNGPTAVHWLAQIIRD